MAVIRHLGFAMRVFGPLTTVLGGLYHCENLSGISITVLYICKFGFKMPLHSPFGGIFGVKIGKMENFCSFIALGMQ